MNSSGQTLGLFTVKSSGQTLGGKKKKKKMKKKKRSKTTILPASFGIFNEMHWIQRIVLNYKVLSKFQIETYVGCLMRHL